MTLLRLRAIQLMLVALIVATPKPYRRELETCFNRLDDEAKAMARRLMQEEGILCGISCGAAMAAAAKLAEKPEMQGKTIVVILPDSGERYLSSMLFSDLFTETELQA